MSRKDDIENTTWAKNFKKVCPTGYNEALEIALIPDLEVYLLYTDESGDFQYVIVPDDIRVEDWDQFTFWLDTKDTYAEAVAVCNEMGWIITNEK